MKPHLTFFSTSSRDAIMIPIPQYPIYSAIISRLGARQVGYYLGKLLLVTAGSLILVQQACSYPPFYYMHIQMKKVDGQSLNENWSSGEQRQWKEMDSTLGPLLSSTPAIPLGKCLVAMIWKSFVSFVRSTTSFYLQMKYINATSMTKIRNLYPRKRLQLRLQDVRIFS